MPYIQYLQQAQRKYLNLPDDRMIIFGREEHTDFQILNDALVSREHFGIEKDGSGKWVVIDLGSRNGTILNGRRLSNEIAPLKSGDKVCAGSQTFVFLLAVPKKSEQDILNEVKRSVDSGKDFKTMMDEIVHTQTQIMKKISYPT